MKYDRLLKLLDQIAPLERYLEIDSSGVQIRIGKDEIRRVLVCLEMNEDVIAEAEEKNIDMIITHHPMLFHPLRRIVPEDPAGRYVLRLIRNGIDVYSSHLPFDAAAGGNNMYLAGLLELDVPPVSRPGGAESEAQSAETEEYRYDDLEIGTIGMLPRPMSFEEFREHVEKALRLPEHYVRCVDGGRMIRKVAFCTGAGGEFVFTAVREGCDAYVTGDVKLHEAQYAKACGLTVIDAGHYGTEKIFTENMAAQLRNLADDGLEVFEAESNTNPYTL